MSVELIHGDCRAVLPTLPGGSVNCCVTSPPYYGLRDYGHDNQIGQEQTPGEFIAELVDVFREVKRVLRDDGTLWINLGDSYAGGGRGAPDANRQKVYSKTFLNQPVGYKEPPVGYKRKDLMGIPWKVAFALQEDGWYLRQDIIWHKPNPMPESVTDRCTKAHEYIFLLSKSPQYYYDHESIKEKATTTDNTCRDRDGTRLNNVPGRSRMGGLTTNHYTTKNKRSVWTVNTKAHKEAHFAVFPKKLIKPCILAGSPEDGTVLDPFGGSGTTGAVAIENRRKAILIELNEEYIDIQDKRTSNVQVNLF